MRPQRLSLRARRGQAVLETRLARLRSKGERLREGMPTWTLWLLGGAAVLALGGRGLTVLAQNYMDLRRVRAEMAELRGENSDLQGRLERLRKDDATLERIARRELGLMKPREVEYRFTPPR